jgi:hypothetical protein
MVISDFMAGRLATGSILSGIPASWAFHCKPSAIYLVSLIVLNNRALQQTQSPKGNWLPSSNG